MDASSFIFHDPSGRRWSGVRRALRVAAVVTGGLAVLLILAVLTSPQVPVLGLGSVAHLANASEVRSIIAGERPVKNLPFDPRREKVKYVRSTSPVIHQKSAAPVRDDQPLVFGYYVNWDRSAMVSLRLNLSKMTHLLPEWLVLSNGKGDLDDETDPTVVKIAEDAHLPILAMLTNFRNGWQAGDLHQVLTNPASRKNLIDNI